MATVVATLTRAAKETIFLRTGFLIFKTKLVHLILFNLKVALKMIYLEFRSIT